MAVKAKLYDLPVEEPDGAPNVWVDGAIITALLALIVYVGLRLLGVARPGVVTIAALIAAGLVVIGFSLRNVQEEPKEKG